MEKSDKSLSTPEFLAYRAAVEQELVIRFGYIPESAAEIVLETSDRLLDLFGKGVTVMAATDLV